MPNNKMESSRLELHAKLVALLGSNHVYYQPPESIKIEYPAIIYERSGIPVVYKDNIQYLKRYKYQITVVDKDPDSEIVEKVSSMKYCRFYRHFAKDGLNHDIFTIIY